MKRLNNDCSKRLRLAKLLWGWEPHETQRTWLLDNAKTKVASCGRRWGKTESAAVDAATIAIARPGSVQMIISPTYDQSLLIFRTVERLLLSSAATRKMAKVVKTPYPRLSICCSVIMARTADDDGRNLRGHSADRVIVDEAAYVRDSVISEVISPMLADRNGELAMISTPFGKNHFYRAFMRGQSSDESISSYSFPSWKNPHISREYIDRQRHELSTRQFSVEYEAQFVDDESCVFPIEDINNAVTDDISSAADYEIVCAGIDWARYSDYTAVVAVGVRDDVLSVIGIERFNRLPWNELVTRVADFLRSHRVKTALADSTSVGDPLLEQLREYLLNNKADICVDGFIFTNSAKREIIEHLAARLGRGTLLIPNDTRLIKELQFFEYELTSAGNVRMNAHSGFHDDLVIALALACKQSQIAGSSNIFLGYSGRISADGW